VLSGPAAVRLDAARAAQAPGRGGAALAALGFAAEPVEQPWLENGPDGRWRVAPDETADDVRTLFLDECARSRRSVAAAGLDEVARTGGRFQPPDPPPTLAWILFHLLQEYARHAGHLDVARELADGRVGE
jgi:Protein of unknown function (DUF664)